MKKPSFRVFLQNLYSLFVYDSHQKDNQLAARLDYFERITCLNSVKFQIMNQLLNKGGIELGDGQVVDNEVVENLINYGNNNSVFFPYKQKKYADKIVAYRDKNLKMPYVLHKDRKLFYPSSYSLESCVASYRFLIEQDQILEGGYLEKAPHCYQSEQFKVEDGDVLVDGGAAEGLFALDLIDKVKHAYLVESDVKWLPALRATFAPYSDKVTIINKFLSDTVDADHTTLSKILSNQDGSCFVKMDIEGAEPKVIKGSSGFLRNRDDIKLSCCSYHYNNDGAELARLFDEIGYWHEFPDGWFFFSEYDMPKFPYFRKALIRACK